MKSQRSKLEITQSSSHNVDISDDAILESMSPSSVRVRVRVRKQSKKISDDQTTNSDFLPIDLIMDICKQLPVKTLVRFRCVSKLWASVISSQDFKKLFLTTSSNRLDRILFTLKNNHEELFFFSLQTHDSGEAIIATYHKTNLAYHHTSNTSFVHDLICFGTDESAYGLVVYNTSTRRSITLPKFDPQSFVIKHFLSYDPIDRVYKVLCMTGQKQTAEQKLVFHVLTLGNENSWKMIEGGDTHVPLNHQICINGVLYYEAYADTGKKLREIVVMSFDVRSEKFDLIKRPDDGSLLRYTSILIRYEGKLAIMFEYVSSDRNIVFRVLEDAKKHEWLKKVFNFRSSWNSLDWSRFRPSLDRYRLVDVNDAGEFILAPIRLSEPPFYVLYYDSKRNSMRRVVILGITEHKLLHWCKRQPYFPIYLLSSQVESLMFFVRISRPQDGRLVVACRRLSVRFFFFNLVVLTIYVRLLVWLCSGLSE